MMDEIPSGEDIEKWVAKQPLDILSRLPDCTERESAKRHIQAAETLAHVARERAVPPKAGG